MTSPTPRVRLLTSLSPRGGESQDAAVASWIALGFPVRSLNAREELPDLSRRYPAVEFLAADRDARTQSGKPVVYVDDLLAAAAREDCGAVLLVNGDLELRGAGPDRMADWAARQGPEDVLFIRRIEHEAGHPRGRYRIGVDGFLFHPAASAQYPASPLAIGMPWWDYWMLLVPLLRGRRIIEIQPPVGWHRSHPSYFDLGAHWLPLGLAMLDLLSRIPDPPLPADMREEWRNVADQWHALPPPPYDQALAARVKPLSDRLALWAIRAYETLQAWPPAGALRGAQADDVPALRAAREDFLLLAAGRDPAGPVWDRAARFFAEHPEAAALICGCRAGFGDVPAWEDCPDWDRRKEAFLRHWRAREDWDDCCVFLRRSALEGVDLPPDAGAAELRRLLPLRLAEAGEIALARERWCV